MNILYSSRHTTSLVLGYTLVAYLTQVFMVNNLNDKALTHFSNTSILVIAHPDDETMFFGPTILNLIDHNHPLLILCLGSSPSTALSKRRRGELVAVARSLGTKVDLKFADDPSLPDDMGIEWDTKTILEHIKKQVNLYDGHVATLITFDSHGVSGHANHRSIFKAVEMFRASLNMNILLLKSVSLVRKYTFFLDSLPTLLTSYLQDKKQRLTLALDLSKNARLRTALEVHESQMIWFRRLYKAFSRYMFINELEYLV